ncbi:recombinase family protein [Gelria sp. Kuro-4]|uniref:recombinase family protein n=1 Tax=Gelria sp. Kuro-4 TaxID=2796927 RepID=UPI001C806917|nr:recombinase family protein [Gelria sp. Kuro-4]
MPLISTAYEEQQTSLDSQIQYYTDYITNHEGWVFAGIYSEQASGTRFDNRTSFNRMMKDADVSDNGKDPTLITEKGTTPA